VKKGGVTSDVLSYSVLHKSEVSESYVPEIKSIHFGVGKSGTNMRTHRKSGKVSIIWRNSASSPVVSMEPFLVR